jgi:hypothetical protein
MTNSEALFIAIAELCLKAESLNNSEKNGIEKEYIRNCIEKDEIDEAISVLDSMLAHYEKFEFNTQQTLLKENVR